MIENLGGITSDLVGLALDNAVFRQKVIANNIANADTPGFIPERVKFEEMFSRFLFDASGKLDESLAKHDINRIRDSIDDGLSLYEEKGAAIELDMETARLAENVLRYKALLEASTKRGSILKTAILEGRN